MPLLQQEIVVSGGPVVRATKGANPGFGGRCDSARLGGGGITETKWRRLNIANPSSLNLSNHECLRDEPDDAHRPSTPAQLGSASQIRIFLTSCWIRIGVRLIRCILLARQGHLLGTLIVTRFGVFKNGGTPD